MIKKTIAFFIIALSFAALQPAAAQDRGSNLVWLKNKQDALRNTDVLNNKGRQIPIVQIAGLSAASVSLDGAHGNDFNAMLNKYAKVDSVSNYPGANKASYDQLNDDLKLYGTVFFQVSSKTTLNQALLNFLQEMVKSKKIVIVYLGKEDRSAFFQSLPAPLIWCKRETAESAQIAAQTIFGGIPFGSQPAIRLQYSVPEDVGINRTNLDSIALIMKEAIAAKAAPGGVVMVVKNGKVIYKEAFGKHTYTGTRAMQTGDIFDMASLTKISATTLEVMRLVEEKRLGLDSPISNYIARTRDMPEKSDIKVKEVMLHQAGFFPFIPFYKNLKPADMSTVQSAQYPTEVADNYFLRANYYKDVMWPEMLQDKILTRGKFVYSDLSMYYMKEIVEKVGGQKMNEYLDTQFYFPLGMQTAGFLPRNRFPKDKIVPTTENDGWFRDMLVQGFVDDPGAAMAGGVSGHAGFFAAANDLAILYQMLLNKGSYGGTKYFEPATVDLFTSGQSQVSRRGLGFDRKDPDQSKGYPSFLATSEVFGHTGYTGTAVWVDPPSQLIYIFLSNRVYPDDKSKALSTLNIRSRVQDVIYRAIAKGN